MAAYAALVSVMHIIDQIQLHPHPPFSLDKKQVESLTENVTFLQEFLQGYSHGGSKEADDLESQIADAAYAAEDVIETHVVDQIRAGSGICAIKLTSKYFYQDLQKVIEDMDFIKKEAMEIEGKMGVQDQPQISSSISADSLRSASASTGQDRSIMVGIDDVLYELLDKLTGGQPCRQIIPIVGMGGIGKTTLARNIYEHQVVVQHFDFLAWAAISQRYSTKEILVEVLQESGESLSFMTEAQLGEKLYKKLSGWRYLIIFDDIWNIEVWDELKFYFPNNQNGSRIVLTTRLSTLAFQLTGSDGFKLNFLDENTSWDLFCKIVFGKKDCPPNLKEIGRKIVKNCKGLPLSIVVIGGILAKCKQTRQYWEHIAENLNSIVNLEDDEHCLKLLYMSYNILPVHLKPCFLYMGVFPEDSEIRVSKLIKLWVAEGFLKSIAGKSLEEAAEEYLKELVDRNLILVHKYSFIGKMKYCKIHDLLRDLCLREAQKQKFICFIEEQSFDIAEDMNTERRFCFRRSKSNKNYSSKIYPVFETASLARSLIWDSRRPPPSFSFKLLRVSSTDYDVFDKKYSLDPSFQQVNLRYLYVRPIWPRSSEFPSSISLLWNLQTLIFHPMHVLVTLPSEIWKMTRLRHVKIGLLELPDPPSYGRDDFIVLENLQTLLCVRNFECGEKVAKRIPNIKKLRIYKEESPPNYSLNSLDHLHKLESLGIEFDRLEFPSDLVQKLAFPPFLKKLTLEGTKLLWEDLTTNIGSLPFLAVLKLKENSCMGSHWETVEGRFCSLKFLLIDQCCDLEDWTTDTTHFPRLEQLHLIFLKRLNEIPSSIGDIPTLQSISVKYCSNSASCCAKTILEEQEELGNVGLKVQVQALWE